MSADTDKFPSRPEFRQLVKTVDKFAETVANDKKLMEDKIQKGTDFQYEVNKDFHTRLTVIETTTKVWLKVIGVLTSILIIIKLMESVAPIFLD